jgi:hypothetical protein
MGAGSAGQNGQKSSLAREGAAGGPPAPTSGPFALPAALLVASSRPPGYQEPATSILTRLSADDPDWAVECEHGGWRGTRGNEVIRRRSLVAIEDEILRRRRK